MKRAIVFLFGIFLTLTANQALTQVLEGVELEGVYSEQRIENRRPIPYQFVRESDVMWSKTIWRRVELREKMNQGLYYPTAPIGDRRSLIDLLMWGIQNKGLTAYDESGYDEFGTIMTLEDIEIKFDVKDEIKVIEDVATGLFDTTIVPYG